jgi:hypothetical protein
MHAGCQLRGRILEQEGQDTREMAAARSWRQSPLEQEGAELIDHGRSPADEPITHAMQRLEIELIDRL